MKMAGFFVTMKVLNSLYVFQDTDVYGSIVVFVFWQLTGGQISKEQVERLFALNAWLLADDCGQHAILQKLLGRVGFVKSDYAQLATKSKRRDCAAASIYTTSGKKECIDFRMFP